MFFYKYFRLSRACEIKIYMKQKFILNRQQKIKSQDEKFLQTS